MSRSDGAGSKYRYPWNTSTSRTLYGPPGAADVVVLVEGASDVMALEQSGLPDGWTTAGCFGSGIHHPQVALVAAKAPKVILAAFDDDVAGQAAIVRAESTLAEVAPVLSVAWTRMGPDLTDAGAGPAQARIGVLAQTLREQGYARYAPEAA